MKNAYTRGGKTSYTTPTIETLDVSIEKGFAESVTFGDAGQPGGNLGSEDFGEF